MNHKKYMTILVYIISIVLWITAVQGCTQKDEHTNKDISNIRSKYSDRYPLQADGKTLTWYVDAQNVLLDYKNMGETPFSKELIKRTGVNIKWFHPPIGADNNDARAIVIASGDLPDIFEGGWTSYPGGPKRLVDDNIIIPLTDAVKKWAPNYSNLLEKYPNVRQSMSLNDGTLYGFPFIRGDKLLRTFWGPFLQKEFLDKYNLSVPETIDEWDNVLRTVKEGEGDRFIPIMFMYQNGNPNPFMQAFGFLTNGLYIGTDGKMHYGEYEDGFKDYLIQFNKWYNDDLFSTEVASWPQRPALRESFLNKKTFADVNFPGSGIGYYLDTAKSLGIDLTIIPAPYPKLKLSDDPRFGHWVPTVDTGQYPVITTACEDIELAVRVLDYGYGGEGELFYNFGIEGDSYINDPTDEDLPIKYTDKILNPENSSTTAVMASYSRANYSGPFIQRKEYILNYMKTQAQKDALFTWYKADAGSDHILPALSFTGDETNEVAQIQADLTTYIKESETAFITGYRSLDEFDAYRDRLRKIGIDRLLEIYQDALERFNQR